MVEGLLMIIAVLLFCIACMLEQVLRKMDTVGFDPQAPCNAYGEGLVDGIQNAIERGQRGISTNG